MKPYQIVKRILFTSLLFTSITCLAQTDTAIVSFKNPASVATAKGYSHAAVVDLGNCYMIVLSGQVPLDNKGNLVGQNNLEMQAEQVFVNIKHILSDLGGSMDNVIKLGIYMTDVSKLQALRNVRDKFINLKNPPTSTLVQVNRLFRADVMLEIAATAIIPK